MELVRKQWKVGIIGSCAALGLLAGTAAAQNGEFERPLARTKNRVPEAGSSQTRIVTQEGDDTYEIVISNGEVSAKVNGKKVPAERIRRSKDKVEILDKNGEVMKSFDIAGPDTPGWVALGQPAIRGVDPDMPKPKVMIGITMSENDDGVVVDHVYEGLAAADAGLKAEDVIVGVDGEGDLDAKKFRELLNKKEPGDKIRLKVRRDGENKELTIELQKFDAEKLGQGQWRGQLKGMEDMPDVFKNNPEAWQRFNEAMKQMPEGRRAFVWGPGQGEDFKFMPFAGGDTKRLEEMQSRIDKKIAELDEKLARINEQMARLEKLISKLGEKGADR